MKNSKIISIFVLSVFLFVCSACTSAQTATGEPLLAATPTGVLLPQPVKETLQVLPATDFVPTATPDGEEQWSEMFSLRTVACEKYISAAWGDEAGQWGKPAEYLFSPAIFSDEDGYLYFFDKVNKRVTVYDGETNKSIAVIKIPEEFTTNFGSNRFSWHEISAYAYQGNLYIPYDQNRIGVVDCTGKIVSRLTIPEKYPLNDIQRILIDKRGGLFLTDDNDLEYYFAPGWQEGQWKMLSTAVNSNISGFGSVVEYGNYLVGISGYRGYSYPGLTLYQTNGDGDFLQSPLVFPLVYPENLLNIRETVMNEAGKFYTIHDVDEERYVLAERSLNSETGKAGFIDKSEIPNVSGLAATNEGRVYLLSNGDDEEGILPGIYECYLARQ